MEPVSVWGTDRSSMIHVSSAPTSAIVTPHANAPKIVPMRTSVLFSERVSAEIDGLFGMLA